MEIERMKHTERLNQSARDRKNRQKKKHVNQENSEQKWR